MPASSPSRLTSAWALVRHARNQAGLTQSELAESATTSQSAIAAYERGRKIPTLPTLERIAQACGLELRITLQPIDQQRRTSLEAHQRLSTEERFEAVAAMNRFAADIRKGRPMGDADAPTLDPGAIIRALGDHDVEYVLVGGMAAAAHGSNRMTTDLDIVPLIDDSNLDRLVLAMESLGARLRVEDSEPLDGFLTRGFLKEQELTTWRTTAGDFDIIRGIPRSSLRDLAVYDDLSENAEVFQAYGAQIYVASLADIMASKLALGRPQDLAAIADYQDLLDLRGDTPQSER